MFSRSELIIHRHRVAGPDPAHAPRAASPRDLLDQRIAPRPARPDRSPASAPQESSGARRRRLRAGPAAQAAESRPIKGDLSLLRLHCSVRVIDSLPSRIAKASRPSTRSSASRPNSSNRQPSRIASPSRRPAASSSSSSDRAISRGATLLSRARILSSSFSRSATSAPSRPRPGPRSSRAGSSDGGQRIGDGQRLHHPRADIVALPRRREAAHLAERLLARRRMHGDVGERLVLHDPAARQILAARLELAPGGERLQPARARRAGGVWILTLFQAAAGSLT